MSALSDLAAQLREENTPISSHVAEPQPDSAFAPPGERAQVIEAVREGYLLHYGESRACSPGRTTTSRCSPATTSMRSASSASPSSATPTPCWSSPT